MAIVDGAVQVEVQVGVLMQVQMRAGVGEKGFQRKQVLVGVQEHVQEWGVREGREGRGQHKFSGLT